jgi:hypothetical protein
VVLSILRVMFSGFKLYHRWKRTNSDCSKPRLGFTGCKMVDLYYFDYNYIWLLLYLHISKVVTNFFSSPDHKVVKVSYSDGAVSVICCRALFVINNWVVNSLAVTVLIGSLSNFVRMFVSMKYRSSSKMGYLRSKTRSQELKIEKAF